MYERLVCDVLDIRKEAALMRTSMKIKEILRTSRLAPRSSKNQSTIMSDR